MKSNWLYRFCYVLLWPLVHLLYLPRYIHRERVPEETPLMVCASHSHIVDPLLLAYLMGWNRPLRFMCKQELLKMPILGGILRGIGSFGVNRGHADMAAIRTSLGILKEGGRLGIFPEGTRLQDSGDGKHGSVMLASRSGALVLPVYISRRKKLFRRVCVVAGEPYTLPDNVRGSEAYAAYTEDLMRRIEQLREEVK